MLEEKLPRPRYTTRITQQKNNIFSDDYGLRTPPLIQKPFSPKKVYLNMAYLRRLRV